MSAEHVAASAHVVQFRHLEERGQQRRGIREDGGCEGAMRTRPDELQQRQPDFIILAEQRQLPSSALSKDRT
jgi:hypothetical protein